MSFTGVPSKYYSHLKTHVARHIGAINKIKYHGNAYDLVELLLHGEYLLAIK
jgi:hypothetical protein